MKSIFYAIATIISFAISGQIPQFAVVRPNGTTYVLSSFDDAYNQAVDDDIIYLPGTTIAGDKTISKRLTVIGTGHYPDSTVYTGKTIFTGFIYLEKKCILEGFEVLNGIIITNSNAAGCSFIRLKSNVLFLAGTNDHFIDESVLQVISGQVYQSSTCNSSTNILVKNSVLQILDRIQYSNINNCLFLGATNGASYHSISNSVYNNCIFKGLFYPSWGFQNNCFLIVGNSSNNCIWYSSENIVGLNNYVTANPDLVMVNSGPANSYFDYSYNYHLSANSPYLTAGSDGTQIGIYGGPSPYKEGAVPSNPHIYFKQIAPQTNSSGQLQIQIKVRTNN